MRNFNATFMLIFILSVVLVGVLGCERNKTALGNVEPEGDAPEYTFQVDKNVPPGGVERP